ncbi:hypothetical protein ACHAWT_005098 [Skeletonema menzelii]
MAAQQSSDTPEVTYLPPPVQGNADYRRYKALRLKNGVTVLLTQDAQSKHFAAAVSVNAGASCDPRSLPGLAHFTEHMCFLGSKRYPEENEYKHFLAQHGGKSNASTSMSHTTYQFDILAEFGEHALDIFSNFFVSPLFTRSGTAREVQAVDSENSKNLVSDGRRRLQVLKALADNNHHYSKFSTGNRITLPACVDDDDGEKKDDDNDIQKKEGGGSDDDHPLKDLVRSIDGNCDDADMAEYVRIALLAFHRHHYRPDNMTVVVVGPQTLDELEKWVVPRFGMIADRSSKNNDDENEVDDYDDQITPEKKEKWQKMDHLAAQMIAEAARDSPPVPIDAAKNVAHQSAFRAELQGGKWPVVVTTKPIQNVRKVVLLFPIPPSYAEPDRSPSHLMSHLFGHEGKGSPFALFQNAGWITSLSSGPRISAPDQNLFQITISLTKEGEENWKDIVKYIFAYAKMLCTVAEETLKLSDGACQSDDGSGKDDLYRIWEEVGKLDRMQFHQTSPGSVYNFAQSASQSISKYGTANCLSAGSLLNETRDSLPLSELLDFCQQIVPNNCFIERCSEGAWDEMEALYADNETPTVAPNGFAFGKQVEKWYGVEYYVSPLDESDVKLWGEGIGVKEMESIHLPEPNRYIPRSLELCEELPEEAKVQRIELPVSPPKLIVNEPSGRLWWKLDERYALPKAYLTVLIRTRVSENKLLPDESYQSSWEYDTKTSLTSELLKSIFADALAIDTYDAYLAGLGWSLSKTSSGFTLTCHGYSDRLPDLALKLLKELTSPSFLEERHFSTAKDKTIRGLSSFFESRRADSLAIYYRNLLLNYKGNGVEENLEIAKAITLRDVEKHHSMIWTDDDLSLEVLYTGNVSEKQARSFFSDATSVIDATRSHVTQNGASEDGISDSWASVAQQEVSATFIAGPLERRLPAGEDIELHFESKNPKEENGAVVVTYQSQHEGFKGKQLSSKETLKWSACVRLISKMIREPCFNELRTKQQLGYIVSSFYDMSYSTNATPLTTSIDSLTVYVLSRKVEPKDVAARIDDFLLNFRSKLEDMPSTEIQDYAESLAKELTKPIRKLGTEANNQFGKIRRYAPETLYADNESSLEDIPFDNAEVVAAALRKLDRNMILDVYDSLIMKKESRSRILTHVYGRTFPLKEAPPPAPSKVYVTSMDELMEKRKSLIAYEPHSNYQRTGTRLLGLMGRHRTLQYAAAAAAVVGVVGVVLFKGRNDERKQTKI